MRSQRLSRLRQNYHSTVGQLCERNPYKKILYVHALQEHIKSEGFKSNSILKARTCMASGLVEPQPVARNGIC